MAKFKVDELEVRNRQRLLTGGIGPRPIALVSTLSAEGIPNLSPFSFFNAFGANPPIVAFSPARRGRDGTLKDTYFNVRDTKECTISMVSFDMVEQVSLASTEYESHIDEFIKSGLTKMPSTIVKPAGVAESPFWMECKVVDIIHTGEENGAGNIVICEILVFHVKDDVLLDDYVIDPDRADIVGRFGGNDYVRSHVAARFEVEKPTAKGIGFDNLPKWLLESQRLTANHLARLANLTHLPDQLQVEQFWETVSETSQYTARQLAAKARRLATEDSSGFNAGIELAIAAALDSDDVQTAWKIILKRDELAALRQGNDVSK